MPTSMHISDCSKDFVEVESGVCHVSRSTYEVRLVVVKVVRVHMTGDPDIILNVNDKFPSLHSYG